MSQCCGKIPSREDVEAIRESIIEYHESQAEKEAIREYIEKQTSNAKNLGTSSSGQTKILETGAVQKISPYNQGEVIQIESYRKDGSIHYTTVNSSTGVRHSYTVLPDGRIIKDHSTNQNVPKGDEKRHK